MIHHILSEIYPGGHRDAISSNQSNEAESHDFHRKKKKKKTVNPDSSTNAKDPFPLSQFYLDFYHI